MASDVEEGKPPLAPAVETAKPRRGCFPACSRALNACTAVATVLCMVALGLAVGLHHVRGMQDFIQQAVRCYGLASGVLILLTETEWERWLESVRLLESWIWRGLVYAFEGLLTLEVTSTVVEGTTDHHRSLQLYRLPAAISLLSCAGLYLLGGVFCFGRRRKASKKREVERLRVQESLLDLDKKRDELRGLLAMYSND